MIKVQFEKKEEICRLSVTGHAGAAPQGSDPVCAAVTALCYTLAQALTLELREKARVSLREGAAEITAPAEGAAEHTFWVVRTGLRMLAYNYPEHITMEEKTNERNSENQ